MSADGASRRTCLEGILKDLEDKASNTAQTLRLTVVANLFAQASGVEFVLSDLKRIEQVIAVSLLHLHESGGERGVLQSRQMASTCLHNLALSLKVDSVSSSVPDQIIMGCLRSLSSEADGVVLERRAIAAAVVLRKFARTKDIIKSAG